MMFHVWLGKAISHSKRLSVDQVLTSGVLTSLLPNSNGDDKQNMFLDLYTVTYVTVCMCMYVCMYVCM